MALKEKFAVEAGMILKIHLTLSIAESINQFDILHDAWLDATTWSILSRS
ncbi:hypothetical protein [Escherichia phage Jahat_MG145]|uniref:Uncharacterized protein n=1 Tax=Escherichia phage Jahat_MG145 TaxID=2562601 RepID=A0A4D6E0B4_9CAUD|nr:hypothetical protein [Escherichia phage Jahat_MG145]